MRYLYLVCAVLREEMYALLHKKVQDVLLWELPANLHNQPAQLRDELSRQLQKADALPTAGEDPEKGIEGIVLVMGLCGGALNGLRAGRHPLIVPRAHDCVTLFLGSKSRYEELFSAYNGKAYWFTLAFMKQGSLPTEESFEEMRRIYEEHYDEENAAYLVDMEKSSLKQYEVLARVDSMSSPNIELVRLCAECSRAYGWRIESHDIDLRLFKSMAEGRFPPEEFLNVPPGRSIEQTNDERIVDVAQST